jgi:hypothetical protein
MPQLKARISDELHQKLVRFCELSTGQISATATLSLALTLFLDAYPDGVTEDLLPEIQSRPKRGRKPGRGSNAPTTTTTPTPTVDVAPRPTAATPAPTPAPDAGQPAPTLDAVAVAVAAPAPRPRKPKAPTPEQLAEDAAWWKRHEAQQAAEAEREAAELAEERRLRALTFNDDLEAKRAEALRQRLAQLGKL